MSLSRKLERERLEADLGKLDILLDRADPSDYLGRLGLEERREEVHKQIVAAGEGKEAVAASAALYFGGNPVVGTRGIESGFGGAAVSKFQDLVSKLWVEEHMGLGQRGPLPAHDARLHITGVLRGSFGFLLEELPVQPDMFDSELKSAVTRATRILEAFGDSSEQTFDEVLAATDPRSLAAAKDFFSILSSSGASLKLVTESQQLVFQGRELERAQDRAITATVDDVESVVAGVLSGILPEQHTFEIRDAGSRGTIAGRVTKDLSTLDLEQLLLALLNRPVAAKVRIRRAIRDQEVARESFLLLALEPRTTAIGPT